MIYHYPKFYYSGNRYEKSDIHWIKGKLERLNDHNQKVVSDQYADIYLLKGRKDANEFLHSFVEEYGVKASELASIRSEFQQSEHLIFAKIEQLKSLQEKARPTILSMTER
ncbi:hypothetical protein Phi2_0066 [Vibrio phage phi 2]|nr:hypothetical protein Phi2_0066 [Vibrio phage phi 2]